MSESAGIRSSRVYTTQQEIDEHGGWHQEIVLDDGTLINVTDTTVFVQRDHLDNLIVLNEEGGNYMEMEWRA